jgi:hypothetical protein
MPGPSSLQHALDRARHDRHDRPAALPTDFADLVMARLPRLAARLTPRPAELFAMATAAVLTAVAISHIARPLDTPASPPPLAGFAGSSGPTLFIAP